MDGDYSALKMIPVNLREEEIISVLKQLVELYVLSPS
jgi:hypothetical protein